MVKSIRSYPSLLALASDALKMSAPSQGANLSLNHPQPARAAPESLDGVDSLAVSCHGQDWRTEDGKPLLRRESEEALELGAGWPTTTTTGG